MPDPTTPKTQKRKLRLVPKHKPPEVKKWVAGDDDIAKALNQLKHDHETGQLRGFAYVAFRRGQSHFGYTEYIEVNPALAVGWLTALQHDLIDLMNRMRNR